MSAPEDVLTDVETKAVPQGEAHPRPEARLGPYEVVRGLGRGGMGAVYLARRADQQYEKLVAVKVVQSGQETEEMLRRFRQERQILAGLDHPNIAKLLDGGATTQGLPYFVMDYVEGEPVDRYCARRGLGIEERLRLFQSVCAPVSHAHRNLVVHRDIKPANILVTAEGVPKLMDFGIAKLLAPHPSPEGAVEGTVFAFTPAYASPEQVRGEPVTTATDVYSLGVVLYELLTGRGPYRVGTRASVEVLKAICEQEPERPSAAVARDGAPTESAPPGGERTARRLRGDLDSIALKALRKEPGQRYASVDALREDIEHHLDGRPVAARRGTSSYRAAKFVRRHWIGVSAASLVLAAIVAGAGLATWGMIRARRAEAEAVRQAKKATAINEFLQETLFSAHPHVGAGRDAKVVDALAAAVPRIANSFADQPEVRAAVQHTVGRTYADLGLIDEAKPLLQASLDTRRRVLGPGHPDTAESLHSVGALAYLQGDLDGAERLWRESLALRLKSPGPGTIPVAESMSDLAMVLQEGKSADYAAAQPLLEESLAIKRTLLGDRDPDVAQSTNNLGMLFYRKKEYDKAEALLRQALALNRELRGNDNADVGSGLNNIGLVLRSRGDFEGSIPLFRESLEIIRKVYGPAHPEVAGKLNNLAVALQRTGRLAEAEAALREALDIYVRAYPGGHVQIPTTRSLLGGLLTDAGRFAEAELLLVSSYEQVAAGFGPDHPRTAACRGRLVRLYEAWGRPQKAAALQPAEGRRP
jgi:serine/threonine-protein kinase